MVYTGNKDESRIPYYGAFQYVQYFVDAYVWLDAFGNEVEVLDDRLEDGILIKSGIAKAFFVIDIEPEIETE